MSFHDQIVRNKIKSFLLIVIIFIFFIILGALISLAFDPSYFFVVMMFASVFSLIYIWASYYYSDKIALASVRAKPASKEKHRNLYHVVEGIAIAAGVPVPKVYVMESEQINAFATGRNPENAVVCVTTGTLAKLDKDELEGVIAHELGHIANYDIRFMTIVAVLVGLISIVAEVFLRSLWFSRGHGDDKRGGAILLILAVVFSIFAPIAANLVSLAISRKREFTADATAVKFTRYPKGLRDALVKIRQEHISEQDKRRYPKAVAPLFISDPFKKKITGLFATHPPVEERIRRLEMM
ncbi:M48 family metallopeptidase [Candidatus Pacearchaeota archaeon]|nr:M48 family metallopeptidase [Candidatus Pacearchaeota archaeon]